MREEKFVVAVFWRFFSHFLDLSIIPLHAMKHEKVVHTHCIKTLMCNNPLFIYRQNIYRYIMYVYYLLHVIVIMYKHNISRIIYFQAVSSVCPTLK